MITSSREKRLGFKSISLKTVNRRIADSLLTDYNRKIKNKTSIDGNSQPRKLLNLKAAFELYKTDRANTTREYDSKTIDAYMISINKLIESCGDKPIDNYTREDYHTFVYYLDGNSQNTKSIRTKNIYSLFNWLVREEYLNRNPFKRVKEIQKDLIIRTPAEIKLFLEYARTTKFYDQVRFQLLAAARLNETLSLKRKWINKKYIRLWAKGNKFREIPILKEMQNLLDVIEIPDDPEAYVFSFTKDSVWRFYQRVRQHDSLAGFHSHDLRSYMLSKFANEGRPMQFVKDYAGHTSIKTTEKYYIRIKQEKVRESFDEIKDFSEINFDRMQNKDTQ